ncbi:uncharacterized protein LOC124840414 isoform X1 [Vigna umbellata]|uniref:uncharacterized protein LOC124840414 isoform X1 n=1 Tax=Vigna umbellata TaxID=87088 RepID=UPI001F5ED847|nr:uncharacterized protein LOC124840414 isoform X1 [Vigna umbellata]XP_047172422.1 uncharacterized protein LOC124840414 isoform X1 [Vigna umbellata]
MEFRNFDPRHTGELLKHMDRQNEVLMEAYRSMFHELRKLQVEEEMLMRKMHEVMSTHGVTTRVDKKEPVAPEAILATREEQRNGKTILEWLIHWKAQPVEEATWEAAETIKEKFPSFRLEDKAETREDGIDGNPLPIVLAQPTSEKPLLVYTRRSKAYVPETSTSFRESLFGEARS